jgi:hypothetical protein
MEIRTAFSPVAPRTAPALIIRSVAVEFVPKAMMSALSLDAFSRAINSAPMPPPMPSSTTMVFFIETLYRIIPKLTIRWRLFWVMALPAWSAAHRFALSYGFLLCKTPRRDEG